MSRPYQSPYSQIQPVPKVDDMSYQGVDLTAEAGQSSTSISWHIPHPLFVIILVGPDETPFGIQKDLLCAQSPYYREELARLARLGQNESLEMIVKLPDTDIETFGCFQNFIFTGQVYDKAGGRDIPDYPLLMGVWKLATQLRMAPLRVAVLDVMAERRQKTSCIPGTPLLIQAWRETEEGSGLRLMLIGWAAEHMRASPEIRNTFAKSLPQEILSELVIVMSDLPAVPTFAPQAPKPQPQIQNNPVEVDFQIVRPPTAVKRSRKSEVGFSNAADDVYEVKPTVKKARKSEPIGRKMNRRASGPNTAPENIVPLTPEEDLNYCRGMINRMLSGPGYWTRLVGPFRNPVDPVSDNVPNYFDVVKRPMDLRTIKGKMDRGEYTTAAEFEADIRLICQNCYEYWTENDKPFKDCLDFEDYFNKQWNARHKWAPTIKTEIID